MGVGRYGLARLQKMLRITKPCVSDLAGGLTVIISPSSLMTIAEIVERHDCNRTGIPTRVLPLRSRLSTARAHFTQRRKLRATLCTWCLTQHTATYHPNPEPEKNARCDQQRTGLCSDHRRRICHGCTRQLSHLSHTQPQQCLESRRLRRLMKRVRGTCRAYGCGGVQYQ
jgi:hypothetical protein